MNRNWKEGEEDGLDVWWYEDGQEEDLGKLQGRQEGRLEVLGGMKTEKKKKK